VSRVARDDRASMDDVGVDAWMMGARVAMMGTDLRVVTRRLRAYVRAIIIRDVMIDGDRRARGRTTDRRRG